MKHSGRDSKVNRTSRINRRRIITASEIGEFAFCEKAWSLKRGGETARSAGLDEGVSFHQTHEAVVARAARLDRAGKKLGAVALILLVALALIRLAAE